MIDPRAVLIFVIVIVCLVAIAVIAVGRAAAVVGGGGARPDPSDVRTRSPHVVVDTLNLAHHIFGGTLSPGSVVRAIDRTAPVLTGLYPGRVMYVLKDKESQLNDEGVREMYRLAAERNRVYISVAEKYAEPPPGTKASPEHSSRARDDFLMALLAQRWKCAVLTEDRLRDFDRFRATVSPFHVYEFAFWRSLPEREYIRPDSSTYARLKRPRTVRYAKLFGPKK